MCRRRTIRVAGRCIETILGEVNHQVISRSGLSFSPVPALFGRAFKLSGRIQKHPSGKVRRSVYALVARRGFEPLISALRGRCPRPLDERAKRNDRNPTTQTYAGQYAGTGHCSHRTIRGAHSHQYKTSPCKMASRERGMAEAHSPSSGCTLDINLQITYRQVIHLHDR